MSVSGSRNGYLEKMECDNTPLKVDARVLQVET